MNIIKSFGLLALISTLSFSATTMCFKQNHKDMSTIETTPLDGGQCKGEKSLSQMKKEGWSTSDIKIDGNSFVYILKKEQETSSLDIERLKQQIISEMEDTKKEKQRMALEKKKLAMSKSGKKLYQSTCQSCHGPKGEIEAMNVSRPLNTLSFEDMEIAINDYLLGDYDRGRAVVMQPYAAKINNNDLKNIYSYLKQINKKEENTKKEASN